MFLASASGGLVALGLVATATGVGTAFYAFGLVLLPTLAFVGLVTFERALQTGLEDYLLHRRIELLREYYFREAPELREYLVSVPATVFTPGSLLAGRRQVFRSVAGMVGVITAVLAGVIAAAGLQMMFLHLSGAQWLALVLSLAFVAGGVALAWVWPKDPTQSWEAWFANFKYSAYHPHAIWLLFLGTMAASSFSSLRPGSRPKAWAHAAIACILLGTMTTFVCMAILIQFGGFSQLPAWVYIVVAVGQSSMAWVLLVRPGALTRMPAGRPATA